VTPAADRAHLLARIRRLRHGSPARITSERSYGAFLRSIALPKAVEADKVKATFKKGVLEVHLSKAKEAKGKTVEVKAE
jgi:HSP20 family molecular chaperone IbpA